MSRRRFVIVDEEDDEPAPPPLQSHPAAFSSDGDDVEVELQNSTLNFRTVSLNSSNPNPSSEPIPLEISDDDQEITPRPPDWTPNTTNSSNVEVNSDCSIGGVLTRLGLKLKREWLESCIRGLERSVPRFLSFNDDKKAKLCFEQFLFSDMNYTGAGVLPEDVDKMHLVDLKGPFILQVDEIVNISCPLRGRYQNASSGIKRCLKLSMTDGVQRVFGMEYRPIKDLEVLAPSGMKVAICNVNVRHGLLMLVPEVFQVLGGLVEELDVARQRLVHEVNKPPRGKRSKIGVVPSLASRATLAAWPPDSSNVTPHSNSSMPQVANHFQADCQGARTSEAVAAPIVREESAPNTSSPPVSSVQEVHIVDRVELEHPLILSGGREIPFTYLASLSAKWVAMNDKSTIVQGKIKCFLTGVKVFHYKKRMTFELQVYIDDGSLISEILIDHNVVQKGIGHSPEEVTGALSSSDMKRVTDMKETLRQFQGFLANFEGTMLVQLNETSPVPIAIEMNQGCPTSDAWLVLRRLKSSTSTKHYSIPTLIP